MYEFYLFASASFYFPLVLLMCGGPENEMQFWSDVSTQLPWIMTGTLIAGLSSMIWNPFVVTCALTVIYFIKLTAIHWLVWNFVCSHRLFKTRGFNITHVPIFTGGLLLPYREKCHDAASDLEVCIEMQNFAASTTFVDAADTADPPDIFRKSEESIDSLFEMKNVVSFSDLCALAAEDDSAETSSDSSLAGSVTSTDLSLSQLGEESEFISPADRLKTLIQNYKDKHNLSERVLKAIYKRYYEQIQADPTLCDVIRDEAVQCRLKSSSTHRRHIKKSFQALPLSKTTIEWI